MSATPSLILIDTNVWLDFFIPSRASHNAVRDLVMYCLRHHIGLLYAIPTIKDVECIVAASFKADVRASGNEVDNTVSHVARQLSWSCVQNMRKLATAVGADESDVWYAEKTYGIHPDFEDDLILAAVERSKAEYLVTCDRQLIQHATMVKAVTPQQLLAQMKVFS